MKDKCLSHLLTTKHFPNAKEDCRIRFKSPFSVISGQVLFMLIRKPLGVNVSRMSITWLLQVL